MFKSILISSFLLSSNMLFADIKLNSIPEINSGISQIETIQKDVSKKFDKKFLDGKVKSFNYDLNEEQIESLVFNATEVEAVSKELRNKIENFYHYKLRVYQELEDHCDLEDMLYNLECKIYLGEINKYDLFKYNTSINKLDIVNKIKDANDKEKRLINKHGVGREKIIQLRDNRESVHGVGRGPIIPINQKNINGPKQVHGVTR